MATKIENILWDELGLEAATEEDKTLLLNQLSETVQNRVALRVSEFLTADELDTFDLTLERNGSDAAIAYLEAVYPNYPTLILEEVERLRAELSQDMAEIEHMAKQKDEV